MSIKLTPLENNIWVEPEPEDKLKKRASGLVLPSRQSSKDTPIAATVVSVGPGPTGKDGQPTRPCIVQKGDKVLIPRDIGQELILPHGTYRLLPDHMCLSKYEEDEDDNAG